MTATVSDGVKINKTTVRIVKGDITDLEVDAFVFYAVEDLAIGSGFGTAISVRGGPSIEKELKELAPLAVGEAVVTEAGKMKAKNIIHAVGPKFQEEDTEGKLRAVMMSTLKKADEKSLKRIAFPAMGAGFYGVPVGLSARVMLETLKSHLEGETGIEEVVIALFDSRWVGTFQDMLSLKK
ncbi:MAG: macro domain-containing protein [Planctomycetota bacterium]|jgi:O-acetyl-ADP-ribose deacetylase (regulator of RNase III)